MNWTELTTILVVLMTSCVCCLATADLQSRASDSQRQQPQPQQQQQLASSLTPAESETQSSHSQQEDHSGSSAFLPKDDNDFHVSDKGRPHFASKRKSKSFSSQWYPRSVTGKRSAEEGSGRDNVVGSFHSVAKRATRPRFIGKKAFRYETRRQAPWFVGKRAYISQMPGGEPAVLGKRSTDFGNIDELVDIDDGVASDEGIQYKRGGIPRFIGKRDPYFSESGEPFRWAEKRIPRFIGKRQIPKFIGKRKRPLFVGKRLSDLNNEEIFEDGELSGESDKRGQPRFIGKRDNGPDLINFVNEMSRQVELQKMRSMILNDKRLFAPEFIGKRSELEDEDTR